MHRSLFRYLLSVSLLVLVLPLCAEVRSTAPVRVRPDLRQMMRRAGMIFAGRVVSIEPLHLATPDQVASVQITLQVEQGIRGARAGEKVCFREWAGLWSAGERYRVGERLMLFLYPPSALGLTSPVGGPAGRFSVDRSGQILLTPAQQQTIRVSPAPVRMGTSRRVPLREFTRALRRMGEE
jgi:hypothetical protein